MYVLLHVLRLAVSTTSPHGCVNMSPVRLKNIKAAGFKLGSSCSAGSKTTGVTTTIDTITTEGTTTSTTAGATTATTGGCFEKLHCHEVCLKSFEHADEEDKFVQYHRSC